MFKVKHGAFLSAIVLLSAAASGQGLIQNLLTKPHLSNKFSIALGDALARPISSKLGRIGCVSVNIKDKSAPIVTLRSTGNISISLSEVAADVYAPPGERPIIIEIANADTNKSGVVTSGFLTFTLNEAEWKSFASAGKLFIFNKNLDYGSVKQQYDAGEQCLEHR